MAKLEKADRALCFTSGMAALAAVTRLIGTGASHVHNYLIELVSAVTYVL